MQNKMLQQMIQFNKLAIDNSFKIMMAVQEQAEKMVNAYLEQTTSVPDEWKKALVEWNEVYQKCCEDCHRSVEESFGKLESLLTAKK
jgi:hypothetical protein